MEWNGMDGTDGLAPNLRWRSWQWSFNNVGEIKNGIEEVLLQLKLPSLNGAQARTDTNRMREQLKARTD